MGNTGQYYSLAVVAVAVFFRFILNVSIALCSTCWTCPVTSPRISRSTCRTPSCRLSSHAPPSPRSQVPGRRPHRGGLLLRALSHHLANHHLRRYSLRLPAGRRLRLHRARNLRPPINMIAFCAQFAFDIMRKDSASGARGDKSEKRFLSGLIRVVLERVHEYVFRLLVVEKTV